MDIRSAPIAITLVLALGGAPAFAMETNWDPYSWNPSPSANDFVLPLPCGGAIAMVKVITALTEADDAEGALNDRRVTLGRNNDRTGWSDYARTDYVAAPFLDEAGNRYFLIGKYETTQRQFQSVMARDAGECPEESELSNSLPASNLSWYDAIEFTRRLNSFWYKEHLDKLPRNGDATSYARLPVEVEWEFAARGGLEVSDSQFVDLRHPFLEGTSLINYAYYGDPQSSRGELNDVGGLKPNPIGIYDTLGNVAEMVMEPYQMNRAGRLHGLHGGVIAKGGSFRSDESDVNSAARVEYPLFNPRTGEEQVSAEVGFRVVVAAPAAPDLGAINTIIEIWRGIGLARGNTLEDDPGAALAELADSVNDLQFKRQLEQVRAKIVTQSAAANEDTDRLVRSTLLNAGFLHQNICKTAIEKQNAQIMVKELKGLQSEFGDGYEEQIDKFQDKLRDTTYQINEAAQIYADQVTRFRLDFEAETLRAEVERLTKELQLRHRPILASNATAFVNIVEEARELGLSGVQELMDLIDPNATQSCP